MQLRQCFVTIASLLLFLATAPACSGPEDPSDDTGGGGTEDTGVADTGGDDTGAEDTGTPDPDTRTGRDTGNDAGDAGDAGDGGWEPVDECSVATEFTGEIASDQAEHGGGVEADANDVLPADTGIQAVWDWMENNASEAEGGTTLPDDETIDIQGAVVVATEAIASGLGNQRFFIQDQNRSIYVRLNEAPTIEDPEADEAKINVGDEISFTVEGVNLYQGETPQISQVSTITVDSADNEVPIHGAEDLGTWGQIHRLGGRLRNKNKCDSSSVDCSAERCSYCYYLRDQEGNTLIEFRSATETQGSKQGFPDGACVTFVGPVGSFPGPLADDFDPSQDLQIQDTNYNDWLLQARNYQ